MKNVKKTLAAMLVFCMVIQISAAGISLEGADTDKSAKTGRDPFSLMYDSDDRLAEELDKMPDFLTEEMQAPAAASSVDKVGRNQIVSERESIEKGQMKDQVLDLVKTGNINEIQNLKLSDEVKAKISDLNESVKMDRYIVKYRSESKGSIPNLLTSEKNNTGVVHSQRSGKMEVLTLDNKVNPKEFAETLQNAGADEDIEYIQPDFQMEYAALDGSLSLTLEAEKEIDENGSVETVVDTSPVESTERETLQTGNTGVPEVIVAVMDTGIDITHPGLADYIWNNTGETADDGIDNDGNGYVDDITGWNFFEDSSLVYDSFAPLQSAHGTHLAGIIASANESNNVKIMPLTVFGKDGAYTSDIIDAIEYAEANGAKIVNCSFGSTDNNPALEEALEDSGMLFVCAVGNARTDLESTPIYPACFDLDNVISVTSTNADGGLSYYSNYSANVVDLAARGRDVRSTLPNGEYGLQSGTSMSAAQVSGVAAAVLGIQNDLNAAALKERLIHTADMLSNLQDTITDGRSVDLEYAILGVEQTEITQNNPKNDFEVNGYAPTQDDLYQLYSSSGSVIQVAAGGSHTITLKEDGSVWAWGTNDYGQCGTGSTSYAETLSQVIGLTDVVQIAAGNQHCLAVKSDGTVWAWGYNKFGRLGNGTTATSSVPVQVSGLTGVVQVAAGDSHSLAVLSDGTVYAWGYNKYGQLGDDATTNSSVPVQVSSLTGISKIAGGYYHSLGLKTDGTLWAWGYNNAGQLGDGTTTRKTVPVQVSNLTGVEQISGGWYHSLAVTADTTVWAWGSNEYAQLGNGSTTNSSVPVQVSNISGMVQLAAGISHSYALKSDGTVWAWGDNGYNQLGDGTTTMQTVPVQVSQISDIDYISSGTYHFMAVASDGKVWAWGYNYDGQLGDGMLPYSSLPVQAVDLTDVIGISESYYHSLAIKADGTLWAWGYNGNGQLGDGTTSHKTAPVQVTGLTDVVQAAAGYGHSLAIQSDGTVWAWGLNDNGQLGDGTTTNSTVPVQISSLSNVVQIAAGNNYSVALKSDGTVWAWGANGYGQLGDGTATTQTAPVQVANLTGVKQIAAMEYHTLALKSNGTVWAWGDNGYGQLGDGTTTNSSVPVEVSSLTKAEQVEAGGMHSLALSADGTVWAWGYNGVGQLGNNGGHSSVPVQVSGLADVERIFAGNHHSAALRSDGTVWNWGYNFYGQLGDGTTITTSNPVQVNSLAKVEEITSGLYHSLALKSDGTVRSWGYNWYGQLGNGRMLTVGTPIQAQAYLAAASFLSSSYTAVIPDSGSSTITAEARITDEYGNLVENAEITYSLSENYPGVSIDEQTGVITVTNEAAAGSVQINAAYNDLSASVFLYIEETPTAEPTNIAFAAQSYSATIPGTGSSTTTVTAQVTDENGDVMEDLVVTYTLAGTYPGVSMDGSTGVVTVTSEATAGSVVIDAEYEGLSCSVTIYLEKLPLTSTLSFSAEAGETYNISLSASSISSFAGYTFTLTYDSAVLELDDLSAFTYEKELTAGDILQTGISIESLSSGQIVFSLDKPVPSDSQWSGILNIFQFTALSSGNTSILIR